MMANTEEMCSVVRTDWHPVEAAAEITVVADTRERTKAAAMEGGARVQASMGGGMKKCLQVVAV